jgi:hypothetical protein
MAEQPNNIYKSAQNNQKVFCESAAVCYETASITSETVAAMVNL